MNTLRAALLYLASGLSIIPIKPDGSKSPAVSEWASYQTSRPTEGQVCRWFDNDAGYGIAIIGGAVSGFLEILDFDYYAEIIFPRWCEAIELHSPGLLLRLVLVRTPRGGWHVYCRCAEVTGNQKLAMREVLEEVAEGTRGAQLVDGRWLKAKLKCLIETRGTGGYALAPLSPPECHPLHLPYVLMAGELTNIPTVTTQEWRVMREAARSFNEYVKQSDDTTRKKTTRNLVDLTRPGDDYNSRADWHSLLMPHGWVRVGHRGEATLWKRPDKNEPGLSATTNYGGSNLLYCFSTNAYPFEDRRGYSLFSAYTLLEHGGDFNAAAKALSEQGYGEQKKKQAVVSPVLESLRRPENTITLEPPKRPANTTHLPRPMRSPASTTLIAEGAR